MLTSTQVLFICVPIALFFVAVGVAVMIASMRSSQLSKIEEKRNDE